MELSKEIKDLQNHVDSMQCVVNSLKDMLKYVDKSWPDHQVMPCSNWHDRSEVPPVGVIWASDGINVWLITSDGKGIPKSATAVKFWTMAFIPHPPTPKPEEI